MEAKKNGCKIRSSL